MPAMNPKDKAEHRKRLRALRRERVPKKVIDAKRKVAARLKRQRHRDNTNPLVKRRREGHVKGQRLIVIRQNAARAISRLQHAAASTSSAQTRRSALRQAYSIRHALSPWRA